MGDEVERRIQAVVFPRRIRIKDFFRDYDKHRCGNITASQFHRALDTCNLSLTVADIETLAAKYAGPGYGGGAPPTVNYVNFAAAIDQVFNVAGLESAPSKPVVTGFVPKLAPMGESLSYAEQEQVMGVLARIRNFVLTRKVLVRPFFQDYEQNQNSVMISQHVTRTQFAQCLAREGIPVSAAETELLCTRFDDRHDGLSVNFNEFAALVDDTSTMVDPIAGPPRPAPQWGDALDPTGGPGATRPSASGVVEGLLARIVAACRVNGVRTKEFFADFDKLRSSAIPYRKFITGLTMALEKTSPPMHLTPEHLLGLAHHFKTDAVPEVALHGTVDMNCTAKDRRAARTQPYFKQFYVDWKAFCALVDEGEGAGAPAAPGVVALDAGREGVARAAMAKLTERISVQGVLVKHFFQDFEANQNSVMIVSHVTNMQFKQCFARLGFADVVSAYEIECIAALFDDRREGPSGAGTPSGLVNYRLFVDAVDPAPPSINPWKTNADVPTFGTMTMRALMAADHTKTPSADPVSAALHKVCTACLSHRIRIHEFFQDFDQLRTGVVTARQFAIALSMAFDGLDVMLAPADISALSSAYRSTSVPPVTLKSSGASLSATDTYYATNFVNWRFFADDVDQVFCTKGLELHPTGFTPATGEMGSSDRLNETQALSAAQESSLAGVLGRIKSRVETRRIQLIQFFKDFEANQNSPMRIGHVSAIQFRQALARLGIEVSDAETALLVAKYRVPSMVGGGRVEFVNFKAFCDEMQPPPPHRNPWKRDD